MGTSISMSLSVLCSSTVPPLVFLDVSFGRLVRCLNLNVCAAVIIVASLPIGSVKRKEYGRAKMEKHFATLPSPACLSRGKQSN